MRRIRMLFGLAAALAAGCLPDRHSLVGRACDAVHPCPDDLACSAGVCALPTAGDSGAAGGGGGSAGGGAGGGGASAGGGGGGSAGGAGGSGGGAGGSGGGSDAGR